MVKKSYQIKKAAVVNLLCSESDSDPFTDFENNRVLSIEDRIAKRFKKNPDSSYMSFLLIIGSIAEAERLWSICKYILPDHRSRLTTQ